MENAWTMRIRGGTLSQIQLPAGGATRLAELRKIAGNSAGIESQHITLKGGYPPKIILQAGAAQEQTTDEDTRTVLDVGLVNMDTIIIEKVTVGKDASSVVAGQGGKTEKGGIKTEKSFPGKGDFSPEHATTRSGRKTTCTSENMAAMHAEWKAREGKEKETSKPRAAASANTVPKKRVKMPGQGRRLDDDIVDAPPKVPQNAQGRNTGSEKVGGPAAKRSRHGAASRDILLGSAVSLRDEMEAHAASDMVGAMEPGKASNPLRVSLKLAREQQGQIEMAAARCAAVFAGEYEFECRQVAVSGAGNAVNIWEVKWRHGFDQISETLNDLSREELIGIIQEVLGDASGAIRANIKPHNMACVSQRTFWNLVRLTQVGPNKTFDQALQELVPDQNWSVLLSRTQEDKAEGFYRVVAGGRASSSRARPRSTARRQRNGGEGGGEEEEKTAAQDESQEGDGERADDEDDVVVGDEGDVVIDDDEEGEEDGEDEAVELQDGGAQEQQGAQGA